MPLNPLIAPSRLDQLLTQVEVPDALRTAALEWADRLDNYQGGVIKEQANRSQFLNLLFHQGLGDRDFLKRAWREAREPILDLRGKITALETELDAAVDAAWEA